MITHVECFGAFHVHFGFEYVVGCRVVSFKRSASEWLFVTPFFQNSDNGNGLLAIEKESTCFGFGGGSRNAANSLAKNMDGTVGLGLAQQPH
jgi:hypothetical protein